MDSAVVPEPLLAPLDDTDTLVSWIAQITRQPEKQVRQRLHMEERNLGHNVSAELKRLGIPPYVWSDRLTDFYRHSDAFLYELAAWNRHPDKLSMRRWVAEFLAQQSQVPLKVLLVGDGLGFDSLYLHRAG